MKETGDDRFLRLYEEQDLLLREGIVIWGQIVQANTLLFTRGLDDCPAAIVYSLDETVDTNPLILQTAAARLFSIKGDDTDEDLQPFSSRLADEHTADWKLKVPTRLTQGIECFYITTMVIRKHLPGRHLKGATFPFLVCPSKTDVGMILPGKYWSRECKRGIWRSRNRASS